MPARVWRAGLEMGASTGSHPKPRSQVSLRSRRSPPVYLHRAARDEVASAGRPCRATPPLEGRSLQRRRSEGFWQIGAVFAESTSCRSNASSTGIHCASVGFSNTSSITGTLALLIRLRSSACSLPSMPPGSRWASARNSRSLVRGSDKTCRRRRCATSGTTSCRPTPACRMRSRSVSASSFSRATPKGSANGCRSDEKSLLTMSACSAMIPGAKFPRRGVAVSADADNTRGHGLSYFGDISLAP